MMKSKWLQLVCIVGLMALTACNSAKQIVVSQRAPSLDSDAWDASSWIAVADAPVVTEKVQDGTRAADGANWFVSTLKNEQQVTKAVWMTSGLGVYEIYVNGKNIGDEVLKPGFTHPMKTKRSFTYDVTSDFKTTAGADNELSAQVTPGWWGDKIVTPEGNDGMIGKKCAFRGVLELTYADGSKKRYGTDTLHWKAGIAGPVKHAAIFDGEEYDARERAVDATNPALSKPIVSDEFKGEILPTDGAEIYLRHDLALAPVRAYIWKDVEGADDSTAYGRVVIDREYTGGEPMVVRQGEHLVIDFGQNCSAVPAFVFNAKGGTRLTCITSELLNDGNGLKSRGMDGPEGSVHRQNLRIPDTGMRIDYTFADSMVPAEWYPHFTFFGYRLISITVTDDVEITSVKSIPVTSIAQDLEIGKISTGNELVNKLISNTLWGQRSNYLSVPTDCPQRNERLGWMADTQVFTETGTFFANTDSFFRKWLRDVRDTQSETGAYPGVAPWAQYGASSADMMRLGWADAGIIVPWTVWKQFGDNDIVDQHWASMEKFMEHVNQTKYDHTALNAENGNYQWADWLSYEPLESCNGTAFGKYGVKSDTRVYWSYLGASYWAIDAAMMCDMARATGCDASKYEAMVDEAKTYLLKRFFNDKGEFKAEILNTMQTPILFALKNELLQGPAKDNMLKRLRKNFEEHGNCLQTGFLGTSILMPILTENRMSDIAYELLFQRKNPSWLYSVDNGATTIWERWNSYMIEEGMGPQGMNSFNHYAYGVVCQWIWETAAGIAADTAQPGFRHIIMKPFPDKRLGHLDAEYKSAAGLIKSSWKYEGDKWIWKFTIPKGATASVTLPGETQSREYQAGSYTIKMNLDK